jgi:hypothetical protein
MYPAWKVVRTRARPSSFPRTGLLRIPSPADAAAPITKTAPSARSPIATFLITCADIIGRPDSMKTLPMASIPCERTPSTRGPWMPSTKFRHLAPNPRHASCAGRRRTLSQNRLASRFLNDAEQACVAGRDPLTPHCTAQIPSSPPPKAPRPLGCVIVWPIGLLWGPAPATRAAAANHQPCAWLFDRGTTSAGAF